VDRFLDQQKARSREALRAVYGFVPGSAVDPLLELISFALKEDQDTISPPPEVGEPTPKQWDTWILLRDRRPKLLLWALRAVMLRENSPVPDSQSADDIAYWAAQAAELALQELEFDLPR
jgi:hypothetical protein